MLYHFIDQYSFIVVIDSLNRAASECYETYESLDDIPMV